LLERRLEDEVVEEVEEEGEEGEEGEGEETSPAKKKEECAEGVLPCSMRSLAG